MTFSDTTNKNGIIQRFESYTGLGDAAVSGDATLLKVVTAFVNDAFDELMPYLLRYMKIYGWDDSNSSGTPTKTVNLVSGTNNYTVTTDGTNDIMALIDVAILGTSTATDYVVLPKGNLSDDDYPLSLSANASKTGIPSKVFINGNDICFDVIPNYSATNGIKYFFNREEARFTSASTTTEPGFPVIFHPLLPAIAAHEWLTINKPTNTVLITRLEAKIVEGKRKLEDFIRAQNAVNEKMTMAWTSYR